MSTFSAGSLITVDTVPLIMAAGGDIDAVYIPSENGDPTSRGIHSMVAYAAPLDRLYDNWVGRSMKAILRTVDAWREDDESERQSTAVHREIRQAEIDASQMVSNADKSMTVWNAEVNATMDARYLLRDRIARALTIVDAAASAVSRGEGRYKLEVTDLNRHADKVYAVYASQGQTSARSIGNALEYSSQVVELTNRRRQYLEQQTQLEYDKQLTRKASKSSGMLGMIAGTALSVFAGG